MLYRISLTQKGIEALENNVITTRRYVAILQSATQKKYVHHVMRDVCRARNTDFTERQLAEDITILYKRGLIRITP